MDYGGLGGQDEDKRDGGVRRMRMSTKLATYALSTLYALPRFGWFWGFGFFRFWRCKHESTSGRIQGESQCHGARPRNQGPDHSGSVAHFQNEQRNCFSSVAFGERVRQIDPAAFHGDSRLSSDRHRREVPLLNWRRHSTEIGEIGDGGMTWLTLMV